MSAELDLLQAVAFCEELTRDETLAETPINGIVRFVAKKFRIEENALRIAWTEKLIAVAQARGAIGEIGFAPDPDHGQE